MKPRKCFKCPACGKQLAVPSINTKRSKWTSTECKHCRHLITLHITSNTLFYRIDEITKTQEPELQVIQLWSQLAAT